MVSSKGVRGIEKRGIGVLEMKNGVMEMCVGYEVTLSELNTQKVEEICLKRGFWGRNWVKAIAGVRSTHKRLNNGYQRNLKVASTKC